MDDGTPGPFEGAYDDFEEMTDPGPMQGYIGADETDDTITADAERAVPTAAAEPNGGVGSDAAKATMDTLTPSGNPREAAATPEDQRAAEDRAGSASPGQWGVPDDLETQPG